MKTLTISTKSKADKVLVASLFHPVNGKTLSPMRYDMGKYSPNPATPFVGRTVEVTDNVYALWTELRKDSDGPYTALFCLTTNP